MKFVLKPSLEHMALVKIAFVLWNQKEVRYLTAICPLNFCSTDREWKEVEERVKEKVPELSLPQPLKEKVTGFISPVGFEVSKWMEFHFINFGLRINLPVEFCWAPQGTIDRKKTAEVLVRDDNLDISTRYKLACIYCMEDDIHKFWNSMTEDLKDSVSQTCPIISFWSRNMKRKGLGNAPISYKDELDHSIHWGNKVAAKYFLQKLTPHEREDCFVETTKNAIDFAIFGLDTDTLCFLLSEMREEQQINVFKNNPNEVLESFLKWPFQSFFIEVANCMWNFLSRHDFDVTLRDITHKVRVGYKDWNYQKLFREFWQKSPNALKSSITDELDKGYLLQSLLEIKDKENFKLILKDSTLKVKEKLIYSDTGNTFCKSFILDSEWDFLEFFIQECLPSKNEKLKFKNVFQKRMMRSYFKTHLTRNKRKWDELFSFSDDSICKYDKESVKQDETCSSKQF